MDWKPHEKSMTMGRLGSHIAEMVHWLTVTVDSDEFDMAPEGEAPMEPANLTDLLELTNFFDGNLEGAKNVLEGKPDSHFHETWALKNAGEEIFSMPRIGAIRTFVLSHIYHHRGQLGVYLRLNDVPVPAVYGPSADEEGF